jgi:hypothetical protein
MPGPQLPSVGRLATSFYRDLLRDIRTEPGVTAAGATRGLPTGVSSNGAYTIEGRPDTRPLAERPTAVFSVVTPDFFHTLRIPLRRGRDFDDRDVLEAPMVTIVNDVFAPAVFGDTDPIGQRVEVGFDRPGYMTIVGVVGDIRTAGPERAPQPEIYMPYEQHPGPSTALTLVIRTENANLGALAATLTRLIRARNRDVPVVADTMDGVLTQATATPRFRTYVLATFAIVALLLAIAGVYGVMAFNVSQRVGEIGVRLAVGATPGDVLTLILAQGATLVAAGIVVGLALSLALSRFVTAFLFGSTAVDPFVLGSPSRERGPRGGGPAPRPARRAASGVASTRSGPHSYA